MNLISDKEMEDITGAKTPSKQCEVLRKNGLRFVERADGRPSLSWEAYNRQLCASEQVKISGVIEPNLRAV
jgi:hypothetical protein